MTRRDLLRAARANIRAARAYHAEGYPGIGLGLLYCAREQVQRAAWARRGAV